MRYFIGQDGGITLPIPNFAKGRDVALWDGRQVGQDKAFLGSEG